MYSDSLVDSFVPFITLFSPAKINLFLRVAGVLPNGYHSLSSLFQAIDLGDRLECSVSSLHTDRLSVTDPSLPIDSKNLILRAFELFRKKSGIPLFVEARLYKKIPIAAGLGGGSGNAATALWACNVLSGKSFPETVLADWSIELGSDVPFFFSHGRAYCTGRGEQIKELAFDGYFSCELITPPFGLSTDAVFLQFDAMKSSCTADLVYDYETARRGDFPFVNDLELAAMTIEPRLFELKAALYRMGYNVVVMSGSGSTFICLGKGSGPLPLGCRRDKVRSIARPIGEWFHRATCAY